MRSGSTVRGRVNERLKFPVHALDAVPGHAFVLLQLPLAAEGQQSVLELDLDVFLLQSRHLRADQDLLLRLGHVDRRNPGSADQILVLAVGETGERLEDSVELRLQISEIGALMDHVTRHDESPCIRSLETTRRIAPQI